MSIKQQIACIESNIIYIKERLIGMLIKKCELIKARTDESQIELESLNISIRDAFTNIEVKENNRYLLKIVADELGKD